ncbi:hypothetical protein C8Q77DRAFT_579460 [Trametes polyzona]|nr:hypothetical protein C8Q77DRAFT_579460 [Trametes polyzona]
MLAAGLLIVALSLFSPLAAVARPTTLPRDVAERGSHFEPPFTPPFPSQPRLNRRGSANGGNAVGGNGGDGQNGQDAVGQNGGDGVDGDDNVAGVDIPAGIDGTFQIGGHTVVIENGHIVSVDGQPFNSGAAGANDADGQDGQDGQDGTATPGKPGIVIGSGSANGGTATSGKGGKGGRGSVRGDAAN